MARAFYKGVQEQDKDIVKVLLLLLFNVGYPLPLPSSSLWFVDSVEEKLLLGLHCHH